MLVRSRCASHSRILHREQQGDHIYLNTHTHRLNWAHSGCLTSYFHTLTDCIEHTVDAWCLTSTYTQKLYWAHSGCLMPYFHIHTDCIEHTVDARVLLPYIQRLYRAHCGCLMPYFHTLTDCIGLYWAHCSCLTFYFHTHTDCIKHTVDAWCLTYIHTQTVLSTQWMPATY